MPRHRLGSATVEVLQAIAAGHRYGFDIMEHTGLPGGTVYPALATLERDGLVRSSWEDPKTARADKRPPRRYYTVARQGDAALRRELDRLRRLSGLLDDPSPVRPRPQVRKA